MSADKFTLFYCLTENGWQSPTEVEDASLPDGWIRIYEVTFYQGSPHGQQNEQWRPCRTKENWRNSDVDEVEQKYQRPTKQFGELSPVVKAWFKKNGI
jgi:hypothetical protein